ncbi:MAG: hypothetical protein COA32_04905 [Fluviicola sp.]|nr:MAG: hypothetical protein COA32_04905 [Fluviicola sp.]
MQEEYLHYLWRLKRLPLNDLKLIDGRKVELVNSGWHNLDAGPDFFNGSVKIDGIQWSGNIEIHVKSSDWYLHKHQFDRAYDNVILHVVLIHDREVLLNGQAIPTLELKNKIDRVHFEKFDVISNGNDEVPCAQHLKQVDMFNIRQQINVALFQRLERKGEELMKYLKDDVQDRKRALLIALFQSFGGRVNKLPMIELAQIIPFEIIAREKWDVVRVEAILFGCAGLLNIEPEDEYTDQLVQSWRMLKSKYKLPEMNPVSWKFSGMRPYSFPTFRLAQLSALLFHWGMDFKQSIKDKNVVQEFKIAFDKPVSKYWEKHFRFNVLSNKHNSKISENSFQLILINGIAPYLVYLQHLEHDFEYSDNALNLLENIPPEKNNITRSWKKIGVSPKNAAESQGLIELKNEFCNFKKCLSCKVGHEVLEKSNKNNNEEINSEDSLFL